MRPDADVAAVSPSSVDRVLSKAGQTRPRSRKAGLKSIVDVKPIKPHAQRAPRDAGEHGETMMMMAVAVDAATGTPITTACSPGHR
jgi:hypothetical protein